jgi:hypothetical protein
MADEQQISPQEILRSARAEKPVTGGTFLQRIGLRLAAWVGTTGAAVILLLLLKWMISGPRVPVLPADPAAAKVVLENYRSLQQIALEPFTTIFDSVIVKVLLPVFTGILGYIFGSRTSRNES